ncbi:hypothetical protein HispidOSU_017653 [Sigmodon hispidus]
MESYLLQLKSIRDSWMSPSSIFMAIDMMFGVMCGVGLFFLLIPFLKKYPVSPPPGTGRNTPKVVRRGRSKTRKNAASVKGCRDDRKNVEETQTASQPMENPVKQPLLDPESLPFWKSNEKLGHFPLGQLLSYLKVLEKFSWIFWGMSSVLSESVVATAWVSKRRSSSEPKTVRFSDSCGPFPALPLAQGHPETSKAKPLPHQFVTPSLAGVTEAQTLKNLPSSTPNQTPSSSRARAYGTTHCNTGMKVLASLRTENQRWQKDLDWKDSPGSNIQNHQAAISQPAHNFPRATPHTGAIRPASTFPEHCQVLQHHEELQTEYRMTKVSERGSPSGVLPSRELTWLQRHYPANSLCQSKNQPELPQPGQPFILDSKSSKMSQMRGSVPSGMPLMKGPAKHNIQDPTKDGSSFRAKDLPCTSSSSPGKGLEPRNPAPRTDQRSYVNTTQDLPFLNPKIQMKLESNIMQLPLKRRLRQHLKTLESRNLTPPGVPTSILPQPGYPSTNTCASKAEYYSKAAMILEKLHHQDPGGTRVETVSAARLQSPLSAHSPSVVQVMQTATPPAVNHGPFKAHPDAQKSYLSTQTRAFCFQARTQQSKTVRGTGRGSLPPRTSPRMPKHEAWKKFQNVASGHPYWSGTMPSSQKRVPPPVVKQANRSKEKEEAPPAWKVTLGSTEIPNGQTINIHVKNFESIVSSRSPGHFQTPPPWHTGASALKSQVYSETDFRSNKQPQAWSVSHCPDSPSSVSLPSEHLLPSFQNRSNKPMASQGLYDAFMRRDHGQETQKLRVPKDTIQAKNHKVSHPNDERKEFMRQRATCQEERPDRGKPPTLSSTQFKDTAMGEFQPSLNMPGKRQSPPESYLKKIIKIILQYLNLSTKDKGEGDSLKNENSPPVMTQELDTTEKLIYNMATEMQSLMNVVVQILVNWLGLNVGDPSESQWCKVEPLIAQLGNFCHSPKGLYDSKNSRPEKIISSSHTSPEGHSHPFLYQGIRDKYQLVADAQRVCDQHQNRTKRGMGIDQLPILKGTNDPCKFRTIGDKQQSGAATQRAYDSGQIRMKSGMDHSPHVDPKRHNQLFMHRDIGDKWQSGIAHKVCDPHQSNMKRMEYGHFTSSKENYYTVMYRGTGEEKSYAAAQRPGHPKWTLPA